MDNIQEIFAYQTVGQPNNQHSNMNPQQQNVPTYSNISVPKELYASTLPNLNVQHFNYDPNTQWISMPVIPTSQNQGTGHLQQVPHQHMTSSQLQLQTPGVSVQRAQTLQYQQVSGETINLAIIQPLFIVNDQQGLIQHLEPVQNPELHHAPITQQQVEPLLQEIAQIEPEPSKAKRKPKRPPEIIQAQREEYLRKKVERHLVKPPCNCKLRCSERISEGRRVCINRQYWQLPYDKQRDFILHSVEILDVKRRKKNTSKPVETTKKDRDESEEEGDPKDTLKLIELEVAGGEKDQTSEGVKPKFRRGWSRVYSLKGDDGKFLTVCKAMFLTTLGFPENVDGALRFLNKQQKGDIRARSPQRGKATPMKGATAKIDREIIKNHILSYKPVVVGRKKGQIRYLPGDLSMKKMHVDFKSKYTERSVSYTVYSEVFRSLNIVFRKDPKMTNQQIPQ